mmetsp:Transcript_16591/g.22407  ORF Transcript_16591/g.22407 Transcript_16591/m.22407 type:complete len:261 (-) Transcript_16591:8-790(-)
MILLFHVLHLGLNRLDLLVVLPDPLLRPLFLLSDRFLDLLLLPASVCDLAIEILNSAHVVCILLFCELNDLVFFVHGAVEVGVLLPVNHVGHALDLAHVGRGRLKPLHVRVLRHVHVVVAHLDVLVCILLHLSKASHVFFQKLQLGEDLVPLLSEQVDLEGIHLILVGLGRLEAHKFFGRLAHLRVVALTAQGESLHAALHHLVRLEQVSLDWVELRRDSLQPVVKVHHMLQVVDERLLGWVGLFLAVRPATLTALSGCH